MNILRRTKLKIFSGKANKPEPKYRVRLRAIAVTAYGAAHLIWAQYVLVPFLETEGAVNRDGVPGEIFLFSLVPVVIAMNISTSISFFMLRRKRWQQLYKGEESTRRAAMVLCESDPSAPQENLSSDSSELRPASTRELWRMIASLIIYGVVHAVTSSLVLYHQETIAGTWYYLVAYWNLLAGPFICGVLWYQWARWRKVR